jgi:hypothetical protein
MRAYRVHVEHELEKPPEPVLAHLAEPHRLADSGSRSDRSRDPDALDRQGAGSGGSERLSW